VILAGKMYGSGSSRDWAAKGPLLLGVTAVIAESFERIHRSNLVGMGIVPLELADGASVEALGLDGSEAITVGDIDLASCCDGTARVNVTARAADGKVTEFACIVRVDTPTEASYLAEGGILTYVLNRIMDGTLTTS
jgi:aconitate hydratase